MKRLLPLLALASVRADDAAADLAKLCGDLPPSIQLQKGKLSASCGSGR